MQKQQSHQTVPLSAEMSGQAALDELYGRLVPIHYALMEGPFGDRDVERWVRERQPFTFVREEMDGFGSIFVYGLRDDADGLLAWLLGWGDAVTVLDPPALRARLVDVAQALIERHRATREAPDRLLSGALA